MILSERDKKERTVIFILLISTLYIMCIYLGEVKGLNYDSQDHIIPAGLGGIKKLPIDYVSREFNNLSSKFEKALLRSSILALPRQILGPGKRGSLNPKRASKSKVNVFSPQPENGLFSLGYIKMGKPYEIPCVFINRKTGEVRIEVDKEITKEDFSQFKSQLHNFESLKIRLLKHSKLNPDCFLLGIQAGVEPNFDCFIASHDGTSNPFTAQTLSEISRIIEDPATTIGSSRNKISTHQDAVINDEYYKGCAKIAFNCLAYIRGKSEVESVSYDPIRRWIVMGGDNTYVDILPNYQSDFQQIFPNDSHQILITKVGNELIADVCFYNYFHNKVRLASDFKEPFQLNGLVCNWKAKEEYDLYEFFQKFLPEERMIL